MLLFRKYCFIIFGLLLIGFSAASLRVSDLGVDPYTAFNIGLSNKIGFSLGLTQILVNLLLFIYVLIFNKQLIGIGTILNMSLVGIFVQYFSDLLNRFQLDHTNIVMKLLILMISVVLFTLGSAMYMDANKGTAPYDAIAPTITRQIDINYQTARSWQDIICVVLAFIFSGPIGIASVVIALRAGSLISKWNKILPKD